MCVFEVQERARLEPLFQNWPETMIWSYLQGCMGRAFTDDPLHPRSAQILIGDFCFLAGAPSQALIRHKPPEWEHNFVIMVPQNESWSQVIETVWGRRAARRERYATQKEPGAFDRDKLHALASGLHAPYVLQPLNQEIFQQTRVCGWARDLSSQFQDWENYHRRGLGMGVLLDGTLVSGASSYTVYRGGIELEIDTRPDHRRRGLALACGAGLILACLDRGLYPSWDAQNLGSLALAQRLGYQFDRAYPVYEVTW